MAKIKLVRQSGNPVDLDTYKKFQEEYVRAADKINERFALDMKKSQRMYRYLDFAMKKKYTNEAIIDIPTTKKQIRALCIQYGCPITFAVTIDGKGVIALLMDDLS